jgi:hypothetical protein
MKLVRNPRVLIPLVLTILLVGAVAAYFAIAANFIQCTTTTCDGTDSDDLIIGTSGGDTITAKKGNDVVFGEDGNDTINGGEGNDTLSGDAGNDEINGGDGNDVLYGGAGNDTLSGGGDPDVYYGGPGKDTYAADTSGKDTYIFMAGDISDNEDISGTNQCVDSGDTAVFIGFFGTEMQTIADKSWVVFDPITGKYVDIPNTKADCIIKGVYDKRS